MPTTILEPASKLSPAKLRANRLNARTSTGPRTKEGKARSSRNAVTHGLFCRSLCIEGEDPAELRAYRLALIRRFNPRDELELHYVEQVLAASWKLRRFDGAEQQLLSLGQLHASTEYRRAQERRNASTRFFHPPSPGSAFFRVFFELPQTLTLMSTYEQRLQNSINRNIKLLYKLKEDDLAAPTSEFSQNLIDELEQEQVDQQNLENEPTATALDATPEAAETSTHGASEVPCELEDFRVNLIDRPRLEVIPLRQTLAPPADSVT